MMRRTRGQFTCSTSRHEGAPHATVCALCSVASCIVGCVHVIRMLYFGAAFDRGICIYGRALSNACDANAGTVVCAQAPSSATLRRCLTPLGLASEPSSPTTTCGCALRRERSAVSYAVVRTTVLVCTSNANGSICRVSAPPLWAALHTRYIHATYTLHTRYIHEPLVLK